MLPYITTVDVLWNKCENIYLRKRSPVRGDKKKAAKKKQKKKKR